MSSDVTLCTSAGTFSRSIPMPESGEVEITWISGRTAAFCANATAGHSKAATPIRAAVCRRVAGYAPFPRPAPPYMTRLPDAAVPGPVSDDPKPLSRDVVSILTGHFWQCRRTSSRGGRGKLYGKADQVGQVLRAK